jgi:hypothetical protein
MAGATLLTYMDLGGGEGAPPLKVCFHGKLIVKKDFWSTLGLLNAKRPTTGQFGPVFKN